MKFRELQPDETRIFWLRHGTTGAQKKELPDDTICAYSYRRIFQLGRKVREAGVLIAQVIMSDRGRGVKSAFAFAEGNALPGETIAPFSIDRRLTDGSHDRPDIVAQLKAWAKEHNLTTEEACLLCDIPEVQEYIYNRALDHALVTSVTAQKFLGKTALLGGHGGLIEPGILKLKNPATQSLIELAKVSQPVKWLDKGGAVELILRVEKSKVVIVEENYLS